ncbi:MAG: hypothetical protein OER95_16350, partial [Acidimicrobiia bacterium]|nr:hypothetical protein [Acidimicrobiia bacterium]
MSITTRLRPTLLAILTAFALVASACGGDDEATDAVGDDTSADAESDFGTDEAAEDSEESEEAANEAVSAGDDTMGEAEQEPVDGGAAFESVES